MTELAVWLRRELGRRRLTQNAASVYAGVGQATISDVLNKGHVPRIETLCRLADFFDTPREQVLRLAGYLPPLLDAEVAPEDEDDYLVPELVALFRRVPDEWKPEALAQVRLLVRLADQPPQRVIGQEEQEAEDAEGQGDEQAGQQAA